MVGAGAMSMPECDPLLPHERPEEIDRPTVRVAAARPRFTGGRGGSIYGPTAGWPWAIFAVLLYFLVTLALPAAGSLTLGPTAFSPAALVGLWFVGTAAVGALLIAVFWAINAASLRLLHSRVKERIAAACRKSSEEDLSRFRYAGVRYDVRQRASLGGALHDIGFVELRPEELVFVGPTVSWAVPREWVKNLAPCRTKGDLDGPLPRFAKELPVPAIVYQPPYAPEPFVVSIVICERPGRKRIAEDSGKLYAELVEWVGDADASG